MKAVVSFILRVFFKIFYRIEVIGLENIPERGRIIVASNHISNTDPPAILSFINKIRLDTVVLAKKELFRNKIFGLFLKKMGAIPLDRQNPDIGALKKSIKALEDEKLLLIFPEGTRKKEGKETNPKAGISFIVKKTKADILPVRIEKVKNDSKLSKIIIVFNKPITTRSYDFNDKITFEKFPEIIMNKIYSINK